MSPVRNKKFRGGGHEGGRRTSRVPRPTSGVRFVPEAGHVGEPSAHGCNPPFSIYPVFLVCFWSARAGGIRIRGRHEYCRTPGVGARTYRELKTWQLADELRRAVIAITVDERTSQDRRFCSSMRSAAGSVCRNLAEGFARRNDREFAQFIRIALGSLAEVSDHLHEATERQLLAIDQFTALEHLVDHVKASATKLLRSLNTNPARHRRV